MSDLVWYERYEEDKEGKDKIPPRNAAFLNEDSPGRRYFVRKKKRIVKKGKKF